MPEIRKINKNTGSCWQYLVLVVLLLLIEVSHFDLNAIGKISGEWQNVNFKKRKSFTIPFLIQFTFPFLIYLHFKSFHFRFHLTSQILLSLIHSNIFKVNYGIGENKGQFWDTDGEFGESFLRCLASVAKRREFTLCKTWVEVGEIQAILPSSKLECLIKIL